ncbi:hypothetical protein LINPERHAP1_LOCUS21919 [Linum perenne]
MLVDSRAEQEVPNRYFINIQLSAVRASKNRSVIRLNRPNDLLLAELTVHGFLQHNTCSLQHTGPNYVIKQFQIILLETSI